MTVAARAVRVAVGPEVSLDADLTVPAGAMGVVAFAHGSGSSRLSPRNRSVATTLQRSGLATMLADLLTADEEGVDRRTGGLRFDVDLLAARLVELLAWLGARPETAGLPLGVFGASTGAAAALRAAAARPDLVAAVVSRGGRPDLAGDALAAVEAPTLLIVGEADTTVLELNEAARARLGGESHLAVVPGATHLFGEPGALEEVARLAQEWFGHHLGMIGTGT